MSHGHGPGPLPPPRPRPWPGYGRGYCPPPYHHHGHGSGFYFGFGFGWNGPGCWYPPPVVVGPPCLPYGFGGFSTVVSYAQVVQPPPVVVEAPPPIAYSAPVMEAAAVQPPYGGYAPPAAEAPVVSEQPAPTQPSEPQSYAPSAAPYGTQPAQPPAMMQQQPSSATPPQAAQPSSPVVVEQPAPVAAAEAQPPVAEKPVEAAAITPAPGQSAEPTKPEEVFFRSMNEGAAAFAAGDYDKARHAFVLAILNSSGRPGNIDAKLAYAITQFAIGDYHVAAMLMRQVIPENPLVVYAEFNLADRYEKKELLPRQVEALQAYIKTHPKDADALVVLGFVQHFSGQREQAKQTFAEALKLSPKDMVATVFRNPPPMPTAPTTQPAAPAPTTRPAATTGNAPTTRPAARLDAPAGEQLAAPTTQPADGLFQDI